MIQKIAIGKDITWYFCLVFCPGSGIGQPISHRSMSSKLFQCASSFVPHVVSGLAGSLLNSGPFLVFFPTYTTMS